MEESHVKCQKPQPLCRQGCAEGHCGASKLLHGVMCIFEKCRADLQAVGICQGVCLDFLPPLGAAVPVNWVVWLAALGAGLRQCCSELPFLRCWEDEAQVSCQA